MAWNDVGGKERELSVQLSLDPPLLSVLGGRIQIREIPSSPTLPVLNIHHQPLFTLSCCSSHHGLGLPVVLRLMRSSGLPIQPMYRSPLWAN